MADRAQTIELEAAPVPRIDFGWVILNSYGNIWHYKLFGTPPEAREYLKESWPRGVPDGFRIVRGKSTVEALPAPGFKASEAKHG